MRPLEISIEGIEKLSIIPDFDFYNLNLVLGLSLQRENMVHAVDTYRVTLEMLYESEQSAFEIVLGFTGVRRLAVPDVCEAKRGQIHLSNKELGGLNKSVPFLLFLLRPFLL